MLFNGPFPDFRAVVLTYLAFEKTKNLTIAFTALKHINNGFLRFAVACEVLLKAGEVVEATKIVELASGNYVFGDIIWGSIVFPF